MVRPWTGVYGTKVVCEPQALRMGGWLMPCIQPVSPFVRVAVRVCPRRARQIRSGVAGMSTSVPPADCRASRTAFMTAAGGARRGVFPCAFDAEGFVGLRQLVQLDGQRRQVVSTRENVLHEAARQRLAGSRLETNVLHQGLPDALSGAVTAARGPAGVRVWEVMSRGRGPRRGRPPPEGVDVAYPPVHNHFFLTQVLTHPNCPKSSAPSSHLLERYLRQGPATNRRLSSVPQ